MILVKRSRPARLPAGSAPTTGLTGSLVGPVMIRPRESVLTAVSKNRSSKGASGGVSKIFRWKASEKVWFERVAVTREAPDANHSAHAAPAARGVNFRSHFYADAGETSMKTLTLTAALTLMLHTLACSSIQQQKGAAAS